MSNKAFTLVELAIVVVIIGLLVGGVLAGQELVKQAKYRRLVGNVESYKAATFTFIGKYNDWPGDSTRHSVFFPGAGIAEGNGNKTIDQDRETYEYWRSLSLAKLIKGSYSGNVGSIQPNSFPKDDANFNYIYKCTTMPGHQPLWTRAADCYYGVSNLPATGVYSPINVGYPILSGAEAFQFDTKFDDGIPSSGTINGYRPSSGGTGSCTNVDAFGSGQASGTYTSTNNSLACAMGFIFNP